MNIKLSLTILITLFILMHIQVQSFFCSSLCSMNACNGISQTACTGCASGFRSHTTYPTYCKSQATTNYLTTMARYQPFGQSPDISQNLQSQLTLTDITFPSTPSTATCIKDASNSYSYYGDYQNGYEFIFSHTGVPFSTPFYKIRIRFWLITIDSWDITSQVKVQFKTNTSQPPYFTSIKTSYMHACQNLCGVNTKNQCFKVVDAQFFYNTSASVQFGITAQDNSQYNPWGIKQITLSARLCHPYCLSCFGDANTECNSCDYGGTYFTRLSNKTCDSNCLTGYGQLTANPSLCIKCADNCTSCLDSQTNCLSCDIGYYLYDDGIDVLCVIQCADGTFQNTNVCTVCDSACKACQLNATDCSSCNPGYYLYHNQCLSSCPTPYTMDSITWKCQPCLASCLSQFKCASGEYLNGNICVTNCSNFYIPTLRQCANSCPQLFYLNTLNKHCQKCMQGCLHCLNQIQCIYWSDDSLNPQNNIWNKYFGLWIAIILAGITMIIFCGYCLGKMYDTTNKISLLKRQRVNQTVTLENQHLKNRNQLTIDGFQTGKKFNTQNITAEVIEVKEPVIQSFGVF